jgi:hypothetical protein
MSKRFFITEEEKKNIKSLYNIKEQSGGDLFKDLLSDLLFGSEDDIDTEEDSFLNKKSSGSVDSKWIKITNKIIDKFEGGYWNGPTPNNIAKSKLGICYNHPEGSMGKSTETMFGMDRYAGEWEKIPEGREFFGLIDKEKSDLGMEKFCKTWKWLYRGGDLEDKLKTLAGEMMKNSYDRNVSNYFSPELKERVENNDRLLLHFAYASWNGPGHFKRFANSLENGIKSGKSDGELIKQAISDRKNSALLHQDKVASVMTSSDLGLA